MLFSGTHHYEHIHPLSSGCFSLLFRLSRYVVEPVEILFRLCIYRDLSHAGRGTTRFE